MAAALHLITRSSETMAGGRYQPFGGGTNHPGGWCVVRPQGPCLGHGSRTCHRGSPGFSLFMPPERAIREAGRTTWSSARTLWLPIFPAAFIWIEMHRDSPMLPLSLFRTPTFSAS